MLWPCASALPRRLAASSSLLSEAGYDVVSGLADLGVDGHQIQARLTGIERFDPGGDGPIEVLGDIEVGTEVKQDSLADRFAMAIGTGEAVGVARPAGFVVRDGGADEHGVKKGNGGHTITGAQ